MSASYLCCEAEFTKKPSENRLSFTQSVAGVPTATSATQYTAIITAAKMGRPSTRFVTTRSILCEVVSLLGAFFTHASITVAIQS